MRNGFFGSSALVFAAARRFFVIAAAAFFVFGAPLAASAQLQQIPSTPPAGSTAQQNVQATAQAAGLGGTTSDLPTIIGRIINIFLGFLGVVFLVLLLYAGYTWMTAGGDVEKVKRAQHTIRNAVIGIFIIGAAWAITNFIFGLLSGTTGGGGIGGSGSGGPGGNLPGSSGSLGSGIIEYHLPERNATNVARNTPIIITFKEPMNPDSFIEPGTGQTSSTQGVRSENIKIFRTAGGNGSSLQSNQARVSYTADRRTFVIKPTDYLGSSTQNVNYSVELKGGSNGIQKADGTSAFSGSFATGYSWQFEVSTVVDLTPPRVVAAIPVSGGQYARNIIIQINFNEAVDPTAATGKTSDGFTNMQVLSGPPGDPNTQPVSGEFRISNRYQTVEFIPSQKCGTNSCGRDVFCLPADHTVETTAKAADIDPQAIPQAIFTNNGYNGVVDVAGNSLDGDGDGAGQGPPNDNFSWSFGTTDSVKLTPPQIESTVPSSDPQSGSNSNIPVDQLVVASFDSLLQSSSLTSESAFIDAHGKDETDPDNFWWFTGMKLLTQSGADYDPAAVPIQIPAKAAVTISHRLYLPSGTGVQNLNYYDPYLLSGIQDVYQNCFNPAATCGSGIGTPNCCNNAPNSNPNGCKPLLNP